MLVERELSPSIKPGEALHPGVEPLLGQLGIAQAALEQVTGVRFPGVWSAWGGPPRFEPFGEDGDGPWLGYQIRRQAFELLLLDRARSAGADVRVGLSVREPVIQNDRVVGAGDIRAKTTIDATGPSRWLSRKLGLSAVHRSPRLIARYGYVLGGAPDYRAAPRIESDAEGWTWIARVDNRLYQWVRLDFDGRLRPREWKPPQLEHLVEARPTQGADVIWRRATQIAGPGWLLIGDAAAQLDPASSHGILKALMSGVMAAQVAVAVLRRGAPEGQSAHAYQAWLTGWFDSDVERLASAYRALGAEGFG